MINVVHVPTDDNVADLFTKDLPRSKFDKLVKMVMGA